VRTALSSKSPQVGCSYEFGIVVSPCLFYRAVLWLEKEEANSLHSGRPANERARRQGRRCEPFIGAERKPLFWIGHNNEEIGDIYSKLKQGVEFRQDWTTRIGLEFEIPSETSLTGSKGPKVEVGAFEEVAVPS
jgi:hypothetical protein